MVAFAKWQYPHTLTPAQKAEKEADDKAEEKAHPRPEGTNTDLLDLFMKMLRERRAKYMDESTGYCKLSSPPIAIISSAVLFPINPSPFSNTEIRLPSHQSSTSSASSPPTNLSESEPY